MADQRTQSNLARGQESSEEEDYMSNNFLEQMADTRPGLVFNRTQARRNETEKKHYLVCQENRQRGLQQSVKHLEKVNREEALGKSSLTEDNKGLSLMKKMGYKTGEGLGRHGKANVEPINVEVKLDRAGLGQAEERKRKCEEIEQLRHRWAENRAKNEKMTANAYLDNKRAKFQLRKVVRSLHKCQKICYQLDSTSSGLKEPELKWFWPKYVIRALKQKELAKAEEAVKIESLPKMEKSKEEATEETTELIKESHHEYYEKIMSSDEAIATKSSVVDLKAVYDASLVSFLESGKNKSTEANEKTGEEEGDEDEDTDDDNQGPNVYKSSYLSMVEKEKALSDASDNEDSDNEENDSKNEELMLKKTEVICMYLKEKYLYCVWCGTKYESEKNFEDSCPGLTEDDHE